MTAKDFITKWNVAFESREQEQEFALEMEADLTEYAEAKAKEFAEWYSKLTPTQKITVHPPAGSGGSICIYEMTIKQLYETFKQSK